MTTRRSPGRIETSYCTVSLPSELPTFSSNATAAGARDVVSPERIQAVVGRPL